MAHRRAAAAQLCPLQAGAASECTAARREHERAHALLRREPARLVRVRVRVGLGLGLGLGLEVGLGLGLGLGV